MSLIHWVRGATGQAEGEKLQLSEIASPWPGALRAHVSAITYLGIVCLHWQVGPE